VSTVTEEIAPKTAPDPESFLDRVRNRLDDLLEIKVVTVVGNLSVTITTDGDSTKTTLDSRQVSDDALVTVVKLTDGDVTTVIAPDLVSNTELRALHATQVAASLEVLPRHLKELVDLARSLIDR
jgi:hypothetical protein